MPALTGKYRPDSATRMKNTRLTIGPAASALGTRVLMPTPMAVKLSMPTTSTRTNIPTSCGPCTSYPKRPTSSSSTTWMRAMIIQLTKMAASSIQVGSGLRRNRFSRPISRRLTMLMARTLKHAAITP